MGLRDGSPLDLNPRRQIFLTKTQFLAPRANHHSEGPRRPALQWIIVRLPLHLIHLPSFGSVDVYPFSEIVSAAANSGARDYIRRGRLIRSSSTQIRLR